MVALNYFACPHAKSISRLTVEKGHGPEKAVDTVVLPPCSFPPLSLICHISPDASRAYGKIMRILCVAFVVCLQQHSGNLPSCPAVIHHAAKTLPPLSPLHTLRPCCSSDSSIESRAARAESRQNCKSQMQTWQAKGQELKTIHCEKKKRKEAVSGKRERG